jgi:hypothetical protein
MFRAANYDWDDPLSAKSFQAWRDRLPEKRDEVIEERDAYRIRTSTDSGELLEATLTLRIPDLQPLVEFLPLPQSAHILFVDLCDPGLQIGDPGLFSRRFVQRGEDVGPRFFERFFFSLQGLGEGFEGRIFVGEHGVLTVYQ